MSHLNAWFELGRRLEEKKATYDRIAYENRDNVGWTTNPDPAAAETPSLET